MRHHAGLQLVALDPPTEVWHGEKLRLRGSAPRATACCGTTPGNDEPLHAPALPLGMMSQVWNWEAAALAGECHARHCMLRRYLWE